MNDNPVAPEPVTDRQQLFAAEKPSSHQSHQQSCAKIPKIQPIDDDSYVTDPVCPNHVSDHVTTHVPNTCSVPRPLNDDPLASLPSTVRAPPLACDVIDPARDQLARGAICRSAGNSVDKNNQRCSAALEKKNHHVARWTVGSDVEGEYSQPDRTDSRLTEPSCADKAPETGVFSRQPTSSIGGRPTAIDRDQDRDHDHAPSSAGMNILAFSKLLGNLKHLPRAGWLRYKIDNPEPVAGHMYRMAVLAFCLDDKNGSIDRNKCMKIALVHDMAESIVGDITPFCGVGAAEKYRREEQGMRHIAALLPGGPGAELYDLWREYEAQASAEARLVKQLDKFDLIAQAFEYERRAGRPGYLQEFFDSTARSITSEPVLGWTRQLLDERAKSGDGAKRDADGVPPASAPAAEELQARDKD